MTKLEVLKQAAEGRAKEVMHYQINIDNYQLAIEEIDANHADKPHLQKFAEHLRGLLKTSIEEQDKEKIMLHVIEAQLESA